MSLTKRADALALGSLEKQYEIAEAALKENDFGLALKALDGVMRSWERVRKQMPVVEGDEADASAGSDLHRALQQGAAEVARRVGV